MKTNLRTNSTILLEALERIGRPRLLVLGDLILDRYTTGDATRVSPEAPVLVLQADQSETRLGGAASVAALARGLDAHVSLAGLVGDDATGRAVNELLDARGIERGLVATDAGRPTSCKERFIGRAAMRHPHQILRVDHEKTDPMGDGLESLFTRSVVARLGEFQAVLVSDYAKGVCTPRVLEEVIGEADRLGVPVLVDPARIADYSRYRGTTILKPNRFEAESATGLTIRSPADAIVAARRLCETCESRATIVTLDAQGMVLCCRDESVHATSTRSREVYDITGAGDMALAMLGLGLAAGTPLVETMQLADIAAGLEVERFGVMPVRRPEIRAELIRGDSTWPGAQREHPLSIDEMALLAEAHRIAGRSIVMTNGCFDLLHAGHVAYLREAAELGDVLIVLVNSDRSARQYKPCGRPVIPQAERADLVAALGCVDHVMVFDDDTPDALIRRIRPDVLVKGGDYSVDEVVGREIVTEYGGRVCVVSKVEGVSTTKILARAHDTRAQSASC